VLAVLAELKISYEQVRRLTERVGHELAAARDQRVEQYRRRELAAAVHNPPVIAAVETDGGRWKSRAVGAGRGVHEPAWREDKVACLLRMQGPEHAEDRSQVQHIVASMHGSSGTPNTHDTRRDRDDAGAAKSPPDAPAAPREDTADAAATSPRAERPAWPPQRLLRSCVATTADSTAFGPMVAAEAQARNFFAAPRRAYLGDGSEWNWTLCRTWFPGFVAILDFLHALCYLFAAAGVASGTADHQWSLYVMWMTACWQGRVRDVLAELRVHVERLGSESAAAAREVLEQTIGYLENNAARMDYPAYRRLGLPVTSSAVESLIKEINYRIKGSEKFWNDGGAEAMLQVRAAGLSDDERLHKHLHARAGIPYRYRRRPSKRRAA
jgi:hypothetical protein